MLLGSPPRMRERQTDEEIDQLIDRITPAYAGKTIEQHYWNRDIGDHPRVCGKDCFFALAFWFGWGSPPRMRERHTLHCPKC